MLCGHVLQIRDIGFYYFSSARNYAELDYELEVLVQNLF